MGVIAAPITLCALVWCGPRAAVGTAGGMAWALANVAVLGALVASVTSRPSAPWSTRVGLLVVKLPVLYAAGALLAVSPWSSPVGFLIGFSLWFVLLVVSACRRAAA